MANQKSNTARHLTGLFAHLGNQAWHQIYHTMLDWIFPPTCVNCGRADAQWCQVCMHDLLQIPLQAYKEDIDPFKGTIATGIHEGQLQRAVQALKYHDVQSLATPLAQRLALALEQQLWTFDMIVPVPLHSARLAQRGYNQAKLISEALSKLLDIPVVDVLERDRDTTSQVGLNRTERLTNVKGAFVVNSPSNSQSALLIDDVRTTGATLRACASALQVAGIPHIYAATITVAPF